MKVKELILGCHVTTLFDQDKALCLTVFMSLKPNNYIQSQDVKM